MNSEWNAKIQAFNQKVDQAFARAQQGEIISLTDLLISKEKLIQELLEKKGGTDELDSED